MSYHQSVSYPVLQPAEPERPSAVQSWKTAVCVTLSSAANLLPSWKSVKAFGRNYVRVTTKYSTFIGVAAVLFAASRAGSDIKPNSLLRIFVLLSLGYNLRVFAPLLLPLTAVYTLRSKRAQNVVVSGRSKPVRVISVHSSSIW
uniref:Uncharacterized protein n=1 Tax=Vannella robusta TaxID=1487602 RepID=A0A7S4ISM8_9EUKA|mmetsp:Transcript_7965/g.9877  ORF Transcript_7965/g.9877 Transcript_7965/m.9877 type:complete len:144 (+) Transcript_7965:156-587(+)